VRQGTSKGKNAISIFSSTQKTNQIEKGKTFVHGRKDTKRTKMSGKASSNAPERDSKSKDD